MLTGKCLSNKQCNGVIHSNLLVPGVNRIQSQGESISKKMRTNEASSQCPKMDGENKGKPYEQMDDLGGKNPDQTENWPNWNVFFQCP